MTSKESKTKMIANSEEKVALQRMAGRLCIALGLAATAGMVLSAAAAPVRLVGVSTEGNTVLIESTEPVAYSVSRPDPLSLVVDMRNVSVSDARADVARAGAIAGVRLEQASATDGRALARVHVALAKPTEFVVRSARNTIRVELKGAASPSTPVLMPTKAVMPAPKPLSAPAASSTTPVAAQPPAAPPTMEVKDLQGVESGPPTATILERIKSSKTPGATTVTLVGNGRLASRDVSETKDRPRRLVIDLPNVTSTAPAQTAIDSLLVTRVRVAVNSRQPLVTRVVMEIAGSASYRVERSGESGRDLAVVFEQARPANTVLLTPAEPSTVPPPPEPPVTLETAMANVAAITQPEAVGEPVDPMLALKLAAVERPVSSSPAPERASAAATPARTSAPPPPRRAAPATTSTAGNAQPQSQAPAAPATVAAPATAPPSQARQAPAPQTKPQAAPAQAPAQTPARPAPTVQGSTQRGDQPRQYTGDPLSLDLDGVDLRAVLRTLADVSGLNMVIDPDVQGSVDIKLTDVPWDQALDVILRGNGLDYSVDGTIVRISKIKTLEDENKARQSAAQAAAERQAQAGGLAFETFPLSYAKAAEIAPLLKGSLRLSKYGQVQVDVRTNTLIIADLPEQFGPIRQLLATLDRAEPQVEVEARIVQTTRDFAKAIGVQWGLNGRVMPDIGNTTSLVFPNQGTIGGRLGGTQGTTDPRATELEQTSSGVRLGVPDATSAIGLALGSVNGAFNLDVALSALERTGKGRVLSTPRLTTQNNIEAEVAQGIQIPIQVVANETVTVSFKDAVLVLRVTPQITAANTVIMKITIENGTADFSRQVNGIPPVNTQRALTQVQIDDGATTVIGGIFVSTETSSNGQVPLLHRIPILGWLFKNERVEDESRELLIFITPRILRS
jgi:type IV pilus secretin PilQ/predicted competence protein